MFTSREDGVLVMAVVFAIFSRIFVFRVRRASRGAYNLAGSPDCTAFQLSKYLIVLYCIEWI